MTVSGPCVHQLVTADGAPLWGLGTPCHGTVRRPWEGIAMNVAVL